MEETPRAGIGRVTAAAVAVAGMLPYLTLKILWLTGSPIGVRDPAAMTGPAVAGLNAVTFGMDAVALVLAPAFTTRRGMRLPAWLVLLPLWVGTGLLGLIVVMLPLGFFVKGPAIFDTGGLVEPWVYAMVYGGFFVQGAGLMTAFVLYARDRWPAVFTTPVGHPYTSMTRRVQQVVAWGALLVTVLIAAARLLGSRQPDALGTLQEGLKGGLGVAAAVALLVLVRARGRGPFHRPLVVAWLGSGSLFGWGLYATVVTVSSAAPLRGGGTDALPGLLELFGLLAGMAMGMCGAFLLSERSGVRDVQAVQQPLEPVDGDRDRQAAYEGHG